MEPQRRAELDALYFRALQAALAEGHDGFKAADIAQQAINEAIELDPAEAWELEQEIMTEEVGADRVIAGLSDEDIQRMQAQRAAEGLSPEDIF